MNHAYEPEPSLRAQITHTANLRISIQLIPYASDLVLMTFLLGKKPLQLLNIRISSSRIFPEVHLSKPVTQLDKLGSLAGAKQPVVLFISW